VVVVVHGIARHCRAFIFIFAVSYTPTGSFEVSVNDKLVYSKLKTGSFPNPNEVSVLIQYPLLFFKVSYYLQYGIKSI
uniref:Uncharacterized protein n=1 Tax=Sander lucioperca TaxID=283035 RepID=A0A8D0ADQ9_SANLU